MQRKKGVCYCDSGTDACKMQGRVPMSSMLQCVNTSMLTFPENSLWVSPSVWLRSVCKTYLFAKQKYFAPIEMLYNILRVC